MARCADTLPEKADKTSVEPVPNFANLSCCYTSLAIFLGSTCVFRGIFVVSPPDTNRDTASFSFDLFPSLISQFVQQKSLKPDINFA